MHTQLKIRAPAQALVSLSMTQQALGQQYEPRDNMPFKLQSCIQHADMAHFFRRCLPQLWVGARGDTSFRVEDDVCERQNQLLQALSQKLPIWLEMWWSYEGMTPGLPLETSGVDWSDFSEPEDLGHFQPTFVVLGYLAGMLDKDIADAYVEAHDLPITIPELPSRPCDMAWFVRQCRWRHHRRCTEDSNAQPQVIEAWADLPMAIKLAGLSTGNAMLDTPFEERHLFDEWLWDMGWTRKALRCAERMSRQANNIMQAMGRVGDWLERDPAAWSSVFDLWLEAHQRYRPKPLVARLVSSQDFVSGKIFRR